MDVDGLTLVDARTIRRAVASRVLQEPDLDPELGDIHLAGHQVDAASRLLSLVDRHGGALLADSTGMGKTFVAIAVARTLGNTLVVAPAALRQMWHEALRRARVAAGVASYEELSRGRRPHARPPALLVLDEAHHARNPASKRYGALADLAWGARVLLLTATPVHNVTADLRALLALFLGARAWLLRADELSGFMVRRTMSGRRRAWASPLPNAGPALPAIEKPVWLEVTPDAAALRAIEALPPPVPVADGGSAHALLRLGLLRTWSSSAAALRSVLRRRLQRAAALTAALEAGRYPTRAELRAWSVVDDALQLGFTELLVGGDAPSDSAGLRPALEHHVDGVRRILRAVDAAGSAQDEARIRHLAQLLDRHGNAPIVAFTQFADTALAFYRALTPRGAIALATGRGARVASGRVTAVEITRLFDLIDDTVDSGSRLMPLRLLVATDVLSEGVSLRRARVLVHLDLPWTVARLEQRVGRLRRLGSPHRRIAVYAIGPPVGARELSAVVRALTRKARMAATLGTGDEPESAPLLGIHFTRAVGRIVERGDHEAVEALRASLATWLQGTPDATAAESVLAVLDGPGLPVEAAWSALAVVRHGGKIAFLRAEPGGVTDRPYEILPLVRALDREGPPDAGQPFTPETRATAGAAIEVVKRWLTGQRAQRMVAPVIDAPSAPHAAAMRYLDGLVAGTPRADLAALLPRVEACRAAVLTSRGAGAERFLERWLDEQRAGERVRSPAEVLAALAAHLVARGAGTRPTHESQTSIVAVLVWLRRQD
jgi:superfamily II DNA or RNA helicase